MNAPLKVVLIGTTTTGKTSIVRRMVHGIFHAHSDCTIGASFIKYNNGNIKYELWDTAGQERFHALLPMYFRSARILIFVFDVSNPKSMDDFDRYTRTVGTLEHYKILIIGNKIDLVTPDELQMMNTQIRKKIENSGFVNKTYDYVFTSAKTGENFDILLQTLNKCAMEISSSLSNGTIQETNIIALNDKNTDLSTKNNDSYKCYC